MGIGIYLTRVHLYPINHMWWTGVGAMACHCKAEGGDAGKAELIVGHKSATVCHMLITLWHPYSGAKHFCDW
jgi:RsiW-degrading membrane proteinase PrsW (M82 family)